MHIKKSIYYLLINTAAFFGIIGLGYLAGEYLYWGRTHAHDMGLGTLFASVLLALLIPCLISLFVIRKSIKDYLAVVILHALLTVTYFVFYAVMFG